MFDLLAWLENYFKANEWTWSLKGRGHTQPTESDFKAALDEAARILYDEEVGVSLVVGRLVIIKEASGLDVYVLAGTYDLGEK